MNSCIYISLFLLLLDHINICIYASIVHKTFNNNFSRSFWYVNYIYLGYNYF